MARKEQWSQRPSEVVFEEAMAELRKGRIPDTMPFVAAYISDAGRERREYMDAITECAFRLNNSNKVLREMANSLQASLMRTLGKKGVSPTKAKYCGDLIPWLAERVQKEQEEGHQKDAEMLASAFEAVLLLVAEERGTVNG